MTHSIVLRADITLEDSFCALLSYDEQASDIEELAKKFKLPAVPRYMELHVSPWLLARIDKNLALMAEHDFMETVFYSTNRDQELLGDASKIVLLDALGAEIVSPSYEVCKGFAPRDAFKTQFFELTLHSPWNRRLTVRLSVTNSYSEGSLLANFSLRDLGFSKKFVPAGPLPE